MIVKGSTAGTIHRNRPGRLGLRLTRLQEGHCWEAPLLSSWVEWAHFASIQEALDSKNCLAGIREGALSSDSSGGNQEALSHLHL